MTTEAGPPVPPTGEAADKAKAKEAKQPAAQAEASSGDKKLSNAELKKRAKEEKAARRAAAKATPPPAAGPQQGAAAGGAAAAAGEASGSSNNNKASKAKAKHDGHQQPPSGAHARSGSRSVAPLAAKEARPKVPECFSHLSMARRTAITQADKDVHPAVLALGQHMGTFAISDSITRLEATLLAFKKVIDSYTTPHGATFSRHFTSHVLNPQIEYLTACRPMCFSMGNAIRWLKLQISKVDIDQPDSETKKLLGQAIDSFVHERVVLADFVIVKAAADLVEEGEVVVTYARHSLVERALLRARADGKRFRAVVVDDALDRAGRPLAERLAAAGVPVTYVSDLGALRTTLREATLVLAAAEAMFSNGAMYARAGTCDVAAAAADMGLRVAALCETVNFTERLAIDSLTYNEIDPDRSSDEAFRLLFDTTRDKYISVVVTELGNTSPKSVPAILRKLEEL
ncbi:hypothetical protein CDD83_8018 [Cordyceps sp. RAO-2017]|nr:hypothetical protein CDD83_8018 [Cordyceps sp. RAO-2017]